MKESVRSKKTLIKDYLIPAVVGILVLFFAFDYGLGFYVNNLPDPVNEDAYYPEEAFNSLYSELENDEMFSDRAERVSGKNLKDISGSRLEKRLLVSGTQMMDLAVTGGDVFDAVQRKKTEQPSVKGYKQLFRCPDGFSDSSRVSCVDSKYPASSSRTYKGWLNLALAYRGGLDRLYNNETAIRSLGNYIERSKFYDSYLSNNYEMKPIEAVHYSSKSGLYLVGESDSPVYVDGKKLNGSVKEHIYHANISLNTGYHNVSREGFSLDLPVYGFKPDYGMEGDEFIVGGTENRSLFFKQAVLSGDGWKRNISLGRNNTRVEPEGNVTQINLQNNNMSVKFDVYIDDSSDERPMRGQAFGMTEEEYERFEWISNNLGFAMEDTKSLQ